MQVFYSKQDQTADSIIERLVAKYAERYDITVATDDLMERTTVETFSGRAMSARQLRDEIDAAGEEMNDRLRKLRRI